MLVGEGAKQWAIDNCPLLEVVSDDYHKTGKFYILNIKLK